MNQAEYYLEVELSELEVRIWVNALNDLPVFQNREQEAERMVKILKEMHFKDSQANIAYFLQNHYFVNAFQINNKDKEKRGVVWYRDWP